ncbi:MAG: hypothetical protein MPJ50_10885 [Pirellulales bacterium]|nr:hypothetical protein [Pirellulales bacterium]
MMTRGLRAILRAACLLVLVIGAPVDDAQAQQTDALDDERADEHVKTGQEILGGGFVGTNHPWYSSETDDATLIPLTPPKPKSTGTSWFEPFGDFFSWLIEGGFRFSLFGKEIHISPLMILMFIIIMVPIIWLLWKLYKNRGTARTSTSLGLDDDELRTDAERVEALPFDIEPADNLLDVARKFAETGRYGDAIIYLFSHQLVELDRAHLIRLTKGKTNRQYLREIQTSKMRSLMEQSTVAFEDAFFGHYEINKDRFERCWSRIDEFQSLAWSGRGAG